MHIARALADPDRWHWFAAGDETLAPPAPAARGNNSPQQVLFEIGLVLAVPLVLAAMFSLLVGA